MSRRFTGYALAELGQIRLHLRRPSATQRRREQNRPGERLALHPGAMEHRHSAHYHHPNPNNHHGVHGHHLHCADNHQRCYLTPFRQLLWDRAGVDCAVVGACSIFGRCHCNTHCLGNSTTLTAHLYSHNIASGRPVNSNGHCASNNHHNCRWLSHGQAHSGNS